MGSKSEYYRKQRRDKARKFYNRLLISGGLGLILMWVSQEASFWDYDASELVVLIMIASGCYLAWFAASNIYHQRKALNWPSTSCVVQAWDVHSVWVNVSASYHPIVYYKYRVNGKNYISDKIHLGQKGGSYKFAEKIASRYFAGQKTKCYHDPEKPERAVLERTIRYEQPILMFLSSVVFYVLGFAFYWWL